MSRVRKELDFWAVLFGFRGSALPQVLPHALFFTLFAVLVTAVHLNEALPDLGVEVTPFELAGGVLSLLLVLRTNAGYDRWWEGRRLWGGITNQCRNLAVAALSYGADDPTWRDRILRLTAAFPYAARSVLRGESSEPELSKLLEPADLARVLKADHAPTAVALLIGESVREGRERFGVDGFALLRIDQERATLIDHLGGCERIMKTPLPRAYRIEIRRFLVFFLVSLPFALVLRTRWLAPAVTFLVATPMLAIDLIGTELQSPFARDSLNHLPLDDICAMIERNVLAMLHGIPGERPEREIAQPPSLPSETT